MVDEASLTGESDPVKKGSGRGEEAWVRSGTQVRGWELSCLGGSAERQRCLLLPACLPEHTDCCRARLLRPSTTTPAAAAQVTEGSGRMLVLAVGEDSEWGRTMALVVGEAGDTPLQEKLGWLATAIGKLGFIVAVICFVVLMIR